MGQYASSAMAAFDPTRLCMSGAFHQNKERCPKNSHYLMSRRIERMKIRLCFWRFCAVCVLFLVAFHLSCGPGQRALSPNIFRMDNAAADTGSSYVCGYQPAPGYPPSCYSNGGCASLTIHYQPNQTAAINANPLTGAVFMSLSNPPNNSPVGCHGPEYASSGIAPWSFYCRGSGTYVWSGYSYQYTSCDCEVWWNQGGSAIIAANGTGDLGGHRQCALLRESDQSNVEHPIGEIPDNIINTNSSVDLRAGNVYHSQRAGPLTFSYNSLDVSSGPLGAGWTHDLNISVMLNPDGTLFFKQYDGNTVWFVPGNGNSYNADVKSHDTSIIVKNADGSYTRTTRYGKVYNFAPSGKLTGITDRNGNTTTLAYTGNDLTGITDSTGRTVVLGVNGGKIVSVRDFAGNTSSISYSPAGLISSISDPLGNTWNFQYDSNNRMVQKTDPSNNVVTYTYDAATGKITSATDPNSLTKSIAYDTTNNISTVTEKDGGIWIHKYDPVYNVPLQITDPYGNKTTYAYDGNNNLLSITYPDGTSTSFTYDANRNVLSQTVGTTPSAAGKTATFAYNAQNRITDIINPAGGTTHFTYDANGNLSSSKDPTGAVTQIQRDSKGNITSVTDPLGHTTQYGYDQYNQLASVTDPTNVSTSLTHDILGSVLSLTDALNNTTSFAYDANAQLVAAVDPLGNTTTFTYDKNGNASTVTDPLQNSTSYTYNYRRRPTQKVDALGGKTLFGYVTTGCSSCNGGGEKLTSLTDPAGSTTNFAYDLRGLLTTATDPLQKATSLIYDVNGRPSSKTDRNGTTLSLGYTPSGMPASVTYPDSSQVTIGYDNLDRTTSTQDSLGQSTYTYDADGRITSYTNPYGFTLGYTYDDAGNLTQITYPDGSTVTYTYDSANRLLTVSNWLNQTTHEDASYTYDAAGRLSTFTQFNGIVTAYTYDAANRLTGMSSSVAGYQFTLDGNGNRTQSVETEPLAPSLSPASTIYNYNTQKNRLLSVGAVNYAYDFEGQLASAGATILSFDCDHRLIETNDGTNVYQYYYDAMGNRLRVIRDNVETRYIYDPYGNLLAEADSSNNITRKYIYGKGLLALATPTVRYYYHFNASGSTIALTDMTGTVVNSYAYEPFGQILAQSEGISQSFKFVGQYGVMAEPNGLYYMRARYYDPSVGRFINEDPLGVGGRNVNLYAYVSGNPISFIDPLGLFDLPLLPQGVVNASAGFGDGLTFGAGRAIRNWAGLSPMVNENSGAYAGGVGVGFTGVVYASAGVSSIFAPIGAGTVALTGQYHHAISARIFNGLENNPSLAGLYRLRDARFVTQARDLACHNGYQQWHRDLDKQVINWIVNNPATTPQEFEGFLKEVYSNPDLMHRFPSAF